MDITVAERERLEAPPESLPAAHHVNCCELCAARLEALAQVLAGWTPTMLAFGELINALQNNPMVAKMAGLDVPSRRDRRRKGGDDAG